MDRYDHAERIREIIRREQKLQQEKMAMSKQKTEAEELHEVAHALGIDLSLEECQKVTINQKAKAAVVGRTVDEQRLQNLRDFFESLEGDVKTEKE